MKPILLTTLTAAFALTATAAEPLKKGDAIPDVAVRNADNQSLAPFAHHQVCQPLGPHRLDLALWSESGDRRGYGLIVSHSLP